MCILAIGHEFKIECIQVELDCIQSPCHVINTMSSYLYTPQFNRTMSNFSWPIIMLKLQQLYEQTDGK